MEHEHWFRLVVAALATWRLTHLLAAEDGPADIIVNMRQRLGDSFFGRLMDCFLCVSLWIAAPMAWLVMKRGSEWPLLWLAISGAACLLERSDGRAPQPISPGDQ